MAKCIMVQGTMSGAGKSLLVTALCRIFLQDGWRVAPFKSQNMALNSYVTPDGLEMGRAQAAQAEAAGIACDVRMNPILLKPSSDMGSQLIVNGEVRGHYAARDYFRMKRSLIPDILAAYNSLAAENDIIVIEGAGSPAEINLRADDIVNMGLAELVDAPVLLVGDIDRGGVFAQLYGTVALLQPAERKRIVGTIINKFRGDASLLEPGLRQLEALTGVPVLGVVPYTNADIDDEDSLSPRLRSMLGRPDLIILPGTKSTIPDLLWLQETGLADAVKARAGETPILGVCGGYQMLGQALRDPGGVEQKGSFEGLGLLPCETEFSGQKTRTRRAAAVVAEPFSGAALEGYEIHMGRTETNGALPFCRFSDGSADGAVQGNVFGTYLHGLFDTGELTVQLANWLAARKGIEIPAAEPGDRAAYRQRQYDLLADAVRQSIDMNAIYKAMEEFDHGGTPTARRH